MMKSSFLFILLVIPFFSFLPISAQSNEEHLSLNPSVRFSSITTAEHGLSHSYVTAILQDQYGFIWIGTKGGLNRFDGHDMTVFRFDPDRSDSLSDNSITALYEDSDGYIWISTSGGGINRFNPGLDTFSRSRSVSDGSELHNKMLQIFSVYQDSRGRMWAGGPDGLYSFDSDFGNFRYWPKNSLSGNSYQGGAPWDIKEDSEGNLWIAAERALLKMNPETGIIESFPVEIGERRMASLHFDQTGNIWIGGSRGLYRFNIKDSRFILFQPEHSVLISDIEPDANNRLWLSTMDHGIYLFDPISEKFTGSYKSDRLIKDSLNDNQIYTLYYDRGGLLWIGTKNGINQYDPRQTRFRHYSFDFDPGNTNDQHSLWGIAAAAETDQFMLGSGNTVYSYNHTNGTINIAAVDIVGENDAEGAICVGQDGQLWVGRGHWLYQIGQNQQENQVYNIRSIRPPHAPPIETNTIVFYRNDLLIGTGRAGLIKFSMKTRQFESLFEPPPPMRGQIHTNYLISPEISDIHIQNGNTLWVSDYSRALSRLTIPENPGKPPEDFTITHYLYDPNDSTTMTSGMISDIYEDRNGTIWIASQNGLTKYDEKSGFQLFSEKNGLSNTFIKAIQDDSGGGLWLSTMNGLSRFDIKTETFRNFDIGDGTGSREFLPASGQTQDGTLLFGGNNGLTVFHPDDITDNPYLAPVVLSNLLIGHQQVSIGSAADTPLQKPIWQLEELTLEPEQRIISFQFASLNYADSHKNQYRYMLEGYDTEWNETDAQNRMATYTELPSGSYTFRVQGSNNSGVWSTKEVKLKVLLLPFWWETIVFRGVIILILAGSIILGYRLRIHSLKKRSKRLEQEVQVRTSQLSERTENLQKSEQRFRMMTDLLPSVVIEMDKLLNVTYINKSGLLLFGYTEDDIQNGVNGLDLLPENQRKKARKRITRHLQRINIAPTEYDILKKDGNTIPVLFIAAPIVTDNSVSGFRASITDISQVKETEKKLASVLEQTRNLKEQAEAANRSKSIFLANMSHELRTPLNAVLGYSQLMARDSKITSKQQEYLEMIVNSGGHLLDLINNVLTMSKIESGRTELRENSFALHQLMKNILGMFKLKASSKGIKLNIRINNDVPQYIRSDQSKIRQILINIIGNAVKFTEEGSVSLTAEMSETKDNLIIQVIDTGYGMAREELRLLFQPFVQTKSGERSQEGTGLGLPISRQFVHLLNGDICFDSELKTGTTCTIVLPVRKADRISVNNDHPSELPRSGHIIPGQTAPDGKAFRILIVEDKKTNRIILEELLSSMGLSVYSAVNGAEGVEMWDSIHPHLIFMDMRMPVMNGYDATLLIKEKAQISGRTAIIVALTASAFEEDRKAIMEVGCDDFIRKPYNENDICNILERLLNIQFTYDALPSAKTPQKHIGTAEFAIIESGLSQDWSSRMYSAIVSLDANLMHDLIQEVQPLDEMLAETMAQWIERFDYEKVLSLLKLE